ncbi:MAG: PIG-L deacetylase family protein [Terriglobales bacterium]
MRRLLCVTAHPDDEAGNFGGTLLKFAAAGVQTLLVCLTAGEAARNRGKAVDNEDLAAIRVHELARSCELLRIGAHQVWGFPDGKLMEANFNDITSRLVKLIRDFQPEVVLTLGPEGGITGHPDHAMAGLTATAAFHWAGRERFFPSLAKPPHQPARLYYGTAERTPPQMPRLNLPPIDLRVDITPYLETKLAAFQAHATQAPLFERFSAFAHSLGGVECFHLAAAPVGLDRAALAASGDLFFGL